MLKIDLIDHFKMVVYHCTTDTDEDYTGQQRYCPVRKNVSDVFLDAEFKYVSRIPLSPTPLSPG